MARVYRDFPDFSVFAEICEASNPEIFHIDIPIHTIHVHFEFFKLKKPISLLVLFRLGRVIRRTTKNRSRPVSPTIKKSIFHNITPIFPRYITLYNKGTPAELKNFLF